MGTQGCGSPRVWVSGEGQLHAYRTAQADSIHPVPAEHSNPIHD